MGKDIHRRWGKRDMLFYCPEEEVVWQYDNVGKVYKYKHIPSYGLPRKKLPQ